MQHINADPSKMRAFGTSAAEFRKDIREQCQLLREATAALSSSMDEEDMRLIRALTNKIEMIADDTEPFFDQLNEAIGIYANYIEKAQKIIRNASNGTAAEKATYLDDNRKLYRVDNDLLPDSEYDINGYHYTTDDQGRIVCAEGTLHLKNRSSRLPIKDSMEAIGKGDQMPGDDRGHLIGDQFDGSNGLENMIPQNSDVNQKDFRNFENELAAEVKNGSKVYYKVEPLYDGASKRPNGLIVFYDIDGDENIIFFPNNPKG